MEKRFQSLCILILILIIGIGVYTFSLFLPASFNKVGISQFVIPKGQAVAAIASRLQDRGLIKNSLAFRLVISIVPFTLEIWMLTG